MRFEKETNLYQDAAIANKFSSQDTQFNVVNGKISYLISDSDIEEYEDKSKTVTSRLNSSEDSIDRHSRQISSLQTDIVGINGSIDTFKSEVNTFEQTTNSTISSITSTVATKTQVWTAQPTVPYLANDFWIRDNVLYVCTVSRAIGSFNASDWKPATKGRIFTSEPTPPYYSGDAWMQGDTGEILFCNATRLTGNCNIDDWKKASKYTDDSAFNNWTQNTYNSFIEQLPSQINLQVTGSREIDANTKYTSKASIIATINDQTFESGVRINADRITLDGDATINAINGATGNVVVNANKVNLNAYATFTALQTAGATIINGANIETGTITAREIGSKTITADNIASNTITANQIASETITSKEIASGTITADQIAAKTITSDEIATGTITANEIATGTITADNIASGTITADKLDVNYLTASDVDEEGSTVISGSRIKTGSINADLIKAGTLQSQDSVNYPNFSINLTDGTITIKKGGIDLGRGSFVVDNDGNVTMKKGSITIGSNENFKVDKNGTVTMKSAIINGYLKPDDVGANGNTVISGKRIITGSIDADKLSVQYLTSTDVGNNGSTTISGSRIKTGIITGYNSNVVFDVANGSLKMNKGSINIGNNFIVDEYGNVTMKSATVNGYIKPEDVSESGNTTISGKRIATGSIDVDRLSTKVLTSTDVGNNGSTTISGSRITTGTITGKNSNVVFDVANGIFRMNSGSINIGNNFIVDASGNVTINGITTISGSSTNISGYATNAKLNDYVTINNLKTKGKTIIDGGNITTGTISAARLDLEGYASKDDIAEFVTETKLKTKGSTKINGGNITTGTISAARLDLTGVLTAYDVGSKGSTTISGDRITTGKITGYNDNVVFDVANGSLKMNKGSINIASKFIVGTDGALVAKSSTFITQQSGYNIKVSSNEMSFRNGTTEYAFINYDGNYVNFLTSSRYSAIDIGLGTDAKYSIAIRSNGVTIHGCDFYCDKTKHRLVQTKNYSKRSLSCYETPSPMFGDIGDAIINDDGYCYINIDPIFLETVSTDSYQVFLQKCGSGDCYVYKTYPTYFIIHGTPNLKVYWEIKCKQFDWDNKRLNLYDIDDINIDNSIPYEYDAKGYLENIKSYNYGEEAYNHIASINEERNIL